MSLMERVREIGAHESHAAEQHVDTARAALRAEMRRAPKATSASKRRRWGIGVGAGVLVGAACAVAAVAVNLVVPPADAPNPADYAAAAEILEDASAAAIGTADPVLEDGQYLRIEETVDTLVTDSTTDPSVAHRAAVERRHVRIWYVPADRSDLWILDDSVPFEVTRTYGPEGEELKERVLADDSDLAPSIEAVPGGEMGRPGDSMPLETFRDHYDEMPREPEALVAWLTEFADASDRYIDLEALPDGERDRTAELMVATTITNALWLDLPPADVRAAMLGALAELRVFTLAETDGSHATLISHTVADGPPTTFTIDMETGVIDEVTTERTPGQTIAPDTPEQRITFSRQIVDSAPEPTT